MPSSVSSISASTSKSTVSTTASDIDHLTPILPYLKLSKLQRGELAINKRLSENWEVATDGALMMALRKERIEEQQTEEKEKWLEAYQRESLKKQEEEEDEDEEPFVPCWEQEVPGKNKTLEPGWLFKILDRGRRIGVK
ncbi:hypothetical protein TWF281_002335 [Arthrobotrys megalospora]